jgi:hypothetical protein
LIKKEALVSDDHVLNFMRKNAIPLTRRNYIDLNWLGDPPEEPLDYELEAEIPMDQLIDDRTTVYDSKGNAPWLKSVRVQVRPGV